MCSSSRARVATDSWVASPARWRVRWPGRSSRRGLRPLLSLRRTLLPAMARSRSQAGIRPARCWCAAASRMASHCCRRARSPLSSPGQALRGDDPRSGRSQGRSLAGQLLTCSAHGEHQSHCARAPPPPPPRTAAWTTPSTSRPQASSCGPECPSAVSEPPSKYPCRRGRRGFLAFGAAVMRSMHDTRALGCIFFRLQA